MKMIHLIASNWNDEGEQIFALCKFDASREINEQCK